MRQRLLSIVLVFTVFAALLNMPSPSPVVAAVDTYKPPLVRVDLGQVEPRGNVAASLIMQITFGVAATAFPAPPTPRWLTTPVETTSITTETKLEACGFDNAPTGTLTAPSGRTFTYQSSAMAALNCYFLTIPWFYGAELGRYTFTFKLGAANLSTSWTLVAASATPVQVRLNRTADPNSDRLLLLAGYAPNTTTTITFYSEGAPPKENTVVFNGDYLATRQVKFGTTGAAALDIVFSRSSPIIGRNILFFVDGLDRSVKLESNAQSNSVTFKFDGMQAYLAEHTLTAKVGAAPATAVVSSNGGTAGLNCPNTLPTRLKVGITAYVTPGDPNSLRPLPEEGDAIDLIPAGAAFQIIGGPVCGRRLGLRWWQVTYQGETGWTAEGEGDTYWLSPTP